MAQTRKLPYTTIGSAVPCPGGWLVMPGRLLGATVLAEELGRELRPMKADIRRLKALGLTESLRVGYRLSPRGEAYLDRG